MARGGCVRDTTITITVDSVLHPQITSKDGRTTICTGDTIALVGATGAGKSTALALLHRSFDPQSGRIEIDGRDVRAIKLTALRRNVGVVSPSRYVELSNGTR